MLLMEYMARELLAEKGIPVPRGVLIDSPDNVPADWLAYPAVLKAQVATGGRGKAGGIKVVASPQEARDTTKSLLGMNIKGHIVERLLLAEKVAAQQELFLSVILDRGQKMPMIVFSTEGGIDIEETARTHPDRIVRVPVNPVNGVKDYTTRYLLDRSSLDVKYFDTFHNIVQRLYQVFWDNDCLLAEINPLMMDENNQFIAADARITIDDSALPIRQPKILAMRDAMEREARILDARKHGFLYIPIGPQGNSTIMSNGSGMLMASLDILQQRGFHARSVLDLGGGATADRIAAGIQIIMNQPGVKGLFANIFGGITRCDEIAAGVKCALEKLSNDQFIIIRMEGTNKSQGRQILQAVPTHRLTLVDRLSEAANAMAERMVRA